MPDELRAVGRELSAVDETAAVVLGMLEAAHPGLLAVDELQTMYTGCLGRESVAVDDALDELAASGLVRRLGPFIVVSRAALRARELQA